MSLKDNVNYVKEELNSEEKFLEGFVKLERFYKKYKLLIISGVIVAIIALTAYLVTSYYKEENSVKASVLFEKVLKDSSDTASLNELKELNTKLYEIALFKTEEGKQKIERTPYFKELVQFENALKEQNIEKLNNLSMENNFLLKEFAIFNKALILTNEGKYNEAKDTLKMIPQTSQVKDLVAILNHYLITK